MSLYTEKEFAERAAFVLQTAQELGADQAQVSLSQSEGFSVDVREQAVESLNREQDLSIHLTVYRHQANGSASLSDWSYEGLRKGVQAAMAAVAFTEADPYDGLPDPDDYAEISDQTIADLALDDGAIASVDFLEDQAMNAELLGLGYDRRVAMSQGAHAGSYRNYRYLATSNGFARGYGSSQHSLSLGVLVRENGDQQSDYAYDQNHRLAHLRSPESIGEEAAKKALTLLNAQAVTSGEYPVLFEPQMAAGLIGHLLSALGGQAQYRKLGFLPDCLGNAVLPDWLTLAEQPHLPGGASSAPFDREGVSVREPVIIKDGRVNRYLLGSYSARRLGMTPTGNGGGVHNLALQANEDYCHSLTDLCRKMGRGVIVHQLMGQGVNALTGDYSRGASGFWVENGEITYPVDGLTIAGNLREMLLQIVALGDTPDTRGRIHAPAILLEKMTVAR